MTPKRDIASAIFVVDDVARAPAGLAVVEVLDQVSSCLAVNPVIVI